jgi:formylglycine-generating enzyme required for sulfatase activity/Leucine-rich repeat (LRR) protein
MLGQPGEVLGGLAGEGRASTRLGHPGGQRVPDWVEETLADTAGRPRAEGKVPTSGTAWWRLLEVLPGLVVGAVFVLVVLGIIIVIKYRGGDGKARELSVELRSTNEGTARRSSEQAPKPVVTLPSRYKNSLGMEFVLVPRGKFLMGGGDGHPGALEVEVPYDFYLGVYEVTQVQWQAVTGSNPSFFSRGKGGMAQVKDIPDAELNSFPVESVTFKDVLLFLERVNAREKEDSWVYRLPKEVEWEYACRGGPQTNKFAYGYNFYLEKPTNVLRSDQANFKGGLNRPCKVGSYQPNSLGLFDMHGNVGEWCDDVVTGRDGIAQYRALRGGSWKAAPRFCSALSRSRPFLPAVRPRNPALITLGLRLARVPVGTVLVSPTPAAPMVPPEDDPDDPEAEDEYAAAKWVVGVGGKVTVLTPKRRLDLAGKTPFPEEAFRVVAVNLEGVKGLTDANLRCLRSCGKMESLGLYSAGPGVTDLHFLDGMTDLQHLDLRETGIGDDSMRPVRALRKLKTLNLRGCANLTSAGLAHLRDLMELEYLNLGLTRITDLKDIAGLKKLENLGFQGAQVTDEGVKNLAGLTGLVALDLRETKVTGGCLMYLQALSKLRALNFDGSQAMGVGLQNLESLPQLELLGLSGTSLSDEDLVCLVPLKRLDTVNLSSTKVTDEGLKKLTALRSLTNLGLGGTRVTDRGMRELTALQRLTALDLSGNAITDVGLKELATMKQLQKLGLQGTQVTEAGVKLLRQALPKCQIQGQVQ